MKAIILFFILVSLSSCVTSGVKTRAVASEKCNIDNYKDFIDKRGVYNCDLQGVIFRDESVYSLFGLIDAPADLRGANLRRANLANANLEYANLEGADLRGAYLYKAYLYKANLEYADLRWAYLRGADLHNAYLDGANLTEAKVTPLQAKYLKLKGLRGFVVVK